MKKYLSLFLTLLLTILLVGCGAEKAANPQDKKTIKVGASPAPHKEILEKAKPILEKEGYELEIVEFSDYVTPNTALEDGEIDANFFQHAQYLDKFNEEKDTHLDYTVKVHVEPMGVYSNDLKDLNDLKDGATIAIPADPTNGSRALRLLENEGVIKIKEGEVISKMDITENPKNIKIEEMEAPQLPRALGEVDAAVINTNYAIEADLDPLKDAIAIEGKDSPYANVIAVREEDKDKEYIKALSKAMNSPELKKFLEDNFKGSIIPAF